MCVCICICIYIFIIYNYKKCVTVPAAYKIKLGVLSITLKVHHHLTPSYTTITLPPVPPLTVLCLVSSTPYSHIPLNSAGTLRPYPLLHNCPGFFFPPHFFFLKSSLSHLFMMSTIESQRFLSLNYFLLCPQEKEHNQPLWMNQSLHYSGKKESWVRTPEGRVGICLFLECRYKHHMFCILHKLTQNPAGNDINGMCAPLNYISGQANRSA